MEQLPLISLSANQTGTLDLTAGGTNTLAVQGVILINQSGFLLTVTWDKGTKSLPAGGSDYFPVQNSLSSQVTYSTSQSQAQDFPNPTLIADIVSTSDPTPSQYPVGGLTNVNAGSVTVNGGTINVGGGQISLYNTPPLLDQANSQNVTATGAGSVPVTVAGFPGSKIGDLGIITWGGNSVLSGTQPSVPSGWAQAFNATVPYQNVFYKVLDSSDLTANVNFSVPFASAGTIPVWAISLSNVVVANTSLQLVSFVATAKTGTGPGSATMGPTVKAAGQAVAVGIAEGYDGGTVSFSDAAPQFTDSGTIEVAAYQIPSGSTASNSIQYPSTSSGCVGTLILIPQ